MKVNIELNSWCATIYQDNDNGTTSAVLKLFYDAALRLKFGAAMVGVLPLPKPLPSGNFTDVVTPFVTVLHCEAGEAETICKEAGITSYFFTQVKIEEDVKKHA